MPGFLFHPFAEDIYVGVRKDEAGTKFGLAEGALMRCQDKSEELANVDGQEVGKTVRLVRKRCFRSFDFDPSRINALKPQLLHHARNNRVESSLVTFTIWAAFSSFARRIVRSGFLTALGIDYP